MKLPKHIAIFNIFLLCSLLLHAQTEVKKPAPVQPELIPVSIPSSVGYGKPGGEYRMDLNTWTGTYLNALTDYNLRLLEKDKTRVVSFSYARRYKLIREYYPDRFEKIKKQITAGRWLIGGFRVAETDGFLLSKESLVRQALYGNIYFKAETGKESPPGADTAISAIDHASGMLSSQAAIKRWNRKNELLAQAAEPLAGMAGWVGAIPYPRTAFSQAWWMVLGNQDKDILEGSAVPKTYETAWNDEIISMNRFASLLESSAGGVTRAMDTRTKGKTITVYNPLAIDREDVVEAEVLFPEGAPDFISVTDPEWKEVPSQVISRTKTSLRILFAAKVPSLGLACFGVQPAKTASLLKTPLLAGTSSLENEFYKLIINAGGDVSSITDKKLNKELLSAPARLEFLKEHPETRPSWSMDWNDRKNPAIGFVDGPATITQTESGPVRITFRIERNARNSSFVQYISLSAGEAGKRIEFRNTVEWQSAGVSLKASFPLTASNPKATYAVNEGITEAGNNDETNYERPSRQWFDLTDKAGTYGVSVLEDCKYGSDKPNDKTLRLTLLYTPAANYYPDQATQDWGTHDFTYALYSHKGDWKSGRSAWQGRMLNQPLRAFQVPDHNGFLGNTFSFVKISSQNVSLSALKKAEAGEVLILRLEEISGTATDNAEVTFPVKVLSASETDDQERKTNDAQLVTGKLIVSLKPFETKTFSVQLADPAEKLNPPVSVSVPIPFDLDVISSETNKKGGAFDAGGKSFPAEQFPDKLVVDGVTFTLGPVAEGKNNAMKCQGQKIPLPKTGNYNKVYFLAAAERDTSGNFKAGDSKKTIRIQGYSGKTGQADRRTWDQLGRIKSVEKGFIRRDELAFVCTHLHKDTMNLPFQYGYLFKYGMDASSASGTLQLPDNPAIRIFAVTVAEDLYDQARPVAPLYDDLSGRKQLLLQLEPRFVTEEMSPLAVIRSSQKPALGSLPFRVTMKDYADMHMPNGVTARYFYSGTEKIKGTSPEQGGIVSAVNDGMFDLMPSDSLHDTWFEKGEGRIVMDLQKQTEIDSLHLFSNLSLKNGPQYFSIWEFSKDKEPVVTGDPSKNGWTYLCSISPKDIEGDGKVVFTVSPKKGNQIQGRYLMFVTEGCSHGPYFLREADVFEK